MFSYIQLVDYRTEFSKWWITEFKTIKFPSAGTVFDYNIDNETHKFLPWTEKVPKFEHDPEIPLQVRKKSSSPYIDWKELWRDFFICKLHYCTESRQHNFIAARMRRSGKMCEAVIRLEWVQNLLIFWTAICIICDAIKLLNIQFFCLFEAKGCWATSSYFAFHLSEDSATWLRVLYQTLW